MKRYNSKYDSMVFCRIWLVTLILFQIGLASPVIFCRKGYLVAKFDGEFFDNRQFVFFDFIFRSFFSIILSECIFRLYLFGFIFYIGFFDCLILIHILRAHLCNRGIRFRRVCQTQFIRLTQRKKNRKWITYDHDYFRPQST